MALQYRIYQDKRKGGSKLFYPRAVHPQTVNLDTIADRIQHNCSMTYGDTIAVLKEMVVVMKQELQNSNKVCIDGLGTFYLSIQGSGAVSEDLFNISKQVKRVKTNFLAQGKKTNGVLTRTFTDGVSIVKAAGYSDTSDSGE